MAPGAATNGCLQPQRWQILQPPPPLPQGNGAPLLLLLPWRHPQQPRGDEALLATLSAEERQRHGRYRRPEDRARFLWGRGGLRHLLGAWLDLPPAAIPIALGPQGKPTCPAPGAPAFNLSHSGDLLLLGFHACRAVGVDVERMRPHLDWLPVARRVLMPAEVAALQALPQAEQASAFLAVWCQLEAQLKARGVGLAGLEALRAGDPTFAALSSTALWTVAVPPGYAAAAALHTPLKAQVEEGAGVCRPSPPA
jgi:4'-phosphopantetheinyl transferase